MSPKKTTKKSNTDSSIPKAVCEAPLAIGKTEISCAVLDTGDRVVSRRQIFSLMKLSSGGGQVAPIPQLAKLPRFLQAKNLIPYINEELKSIKIIEYSRKQGRTAFGVKADFLPMICKVFVDAEADNVLNANQKPIAKMSRILLGAFATIGIIALIDEATGYQNVRAENALAKILEKYLDEEIHKWTKTFPIEFYQQIYRLKGWEWEQLENGKKPRTPAIIGRYTDDWVYKRIAPGVLNELKRLNPDRRVRHHQWFNEDLGHPKLREHISAIIAIMKVSDDWNDCKKKINKAFPLEWDEDSLFFIVSENNA